MSVSHLLEDFGAYSRTGGGELTDVLIEEERLEAFEKGYQAGWDDSAAAQKDTARHVSADLAQNLKDLSFTYQEAYSGMLKGLRPLVEQMVEQLLPRLARETLAPRVGELIGDLIARHGRQPVRLVASPADISVLEDLVEGDDHLPVTVSGDPSMAEGQVRLRFGEVAEHEIDLADVLGSIGQAITAYFDSDTSDKRERA